MSLKYCPTCDGKVDSDSPFCPHCNKLKPTEGWLPVVVEPTEFKNITIILPSCNSRYINASVNLSAKLRKGYQYADWVYSDFSKQLKTQVEIQYSNSESEFCRGRIKLKANSTQTIKLKVPYEAEVYFLCHDASTNFFSMPLSSGDSSNHLFKEGTYQVTINSHFLKKSDYSVVKIG